MASNGSDAGAAQTASRRGELGLIACTALVVGNMIGSGVFLLPAALAAFGPIATLGWVVTSAGAMTLAIVFGRLARMVPATGGPYAYSRAGFGEFVGFLVAWGYWITLWTGNAGVAVAFAGYIGYFFPEWSQHSSFGLGVALAAIWLVTLVNVRGVKEAGAVQVVTTLLKIVPLVLIAVVGLAYVDLGRFAPWNMSRSSNVSAVAACAALTLWAFLGLESATVPAGNVRRPEVTIPRTTIVGTAFAATLYILVTIVAFGAVRLSELAQSSAPLAVVATAM
jgi:basic amino acid/polyamine antiporter, APA family